MHKTRFCQSFLRWLLSRYFLDSRRCAENHQMDHLSFSNSRRHSFKSYDIQRNDLAEISDSELGWSNFFYLIWGICWRKWWANDWVGTTPKDSSWRYGILEWLVEWWNQISSNNQIRRWNSFSQWKKWFCPRCKTWNWERLGIRRHKTLSGIFQRSGRPMAASIWKPSPGRLRLRIDKTTLWWKHMSKYMEIRACFACHHLSSSYKASQNQNNLCQGQSGKEDLSSSPKVSSWLQEEDMSSHWVWFRLLLNSPRANSPDSALVYRTTIAPLDQPAAAITDTYKPQYAHPYLPPQQQPPLTSTNIGR